MILVIDNYDSFTFNLVQALEAAGAEVRVVRNDAIDRAGVESLAASPSSSRSIPPAVVRSTGSRSIARSAG